MEWSKLYSNENNEHFPNEDFLALNEAALTIPVAESLFLGRNQPLILRQNKIPGKHFVPAPADDPDAKKQRVNPTTPLIRTYNLQLKYITIPASTKPTRWVCGTREQTFCQ